MLSETEMNSKMYLDTNGDNSPFSKTFHLFTIIHFDQRNTLLLSVNVPEKAKENFFMLIWAFTICAEHDRYM